MEWAVRLLKPVQSFYINSKAHVKVLGKLNNEFLVDVSMRRLITMSWLCDTYYGQAWKEVDVKLV